jgi:predicted metal-dependent hydrolase
VDLSKDLIGGPQDPPRSRRIPFDFDRSCPPDWMGGSYAYSCLLNAYSFVFPALETIMVSHIARAAGVAGAAADQTALRGFLQQEGAHAREHRRSIDCIRAQGYAVEKLRRRTDRLVRGIDVMLRRVLRPAFGEVFVVAVFAAAEHWTAALAEESLTPTARVATVGRLEHPPPTDLSEMEVLFLWHVAEELEHKSVVADLFTALGGREASRLGAFALASTGFLLIVGLGFGSLLLQARTVLDAREWARCGGWRGLARGVAADLRDVPGAFARTIRSYLRPGYHPRSHDTDALVRSAFERLRALRTP